MYKKIITSLLFLLLFSSVRSQVFRRIKDPLLLTTTIRYYDVEAQLILQKTLKDQVSQPPIYELGLIAFDKTIASDSFMDPNAIVIFEDDSEWVCRTP